MKVYWIDKDAIAFADTTDGNTFSGPSVVQQRFMHLDMMLHLYQQKMEA